MTRAQVLIAADELHRKALVAETRAANTTGPERQRALNEATRLHERAERLRALAPVAALREIGRAA